MDSEIRPDVWRLVGPQNDSARIVSKGRSFRDKCSETYLLKFRRYLTAKGSNPTDHFVVALGMHCHFRECGASVGSQVWSASAARLSFRLRGAKEPAANGISQLKTGSCLPGCNTLRIPRGSSPSVRASRKRKASMERESTLFTSRIRDPLATCRQYSAPSNLHPCPLPICCRSFVPIFSLYSPCLLSQSIEKTTRNCLEKRSRAEVAENRSWAR